MQHPGLFIVIEGVDGSGKTTQFRLLKERLEAVGYDVEIFKFPQYDKPSSHFIKRYLNGDYGPANSVSPYTASLFYALDRFEASEDIRRALAQGKVVLSDRYVGANMAHQGSKFTNEGEQRGFFVWEDSLEFHLLNLPRPNLTLFLRLPAEISQKLIRDREVRDGTALHEHEDDIKHLRLSVETYDRLCQLFPKDFQAIDCMAGDKLLSIPAISDLIWMVLQPLLKNIKKHQPHSKVVHLTEPPAIAPTEPDISLAETKTSGREAANIELKDVSLLAARHLFQTDGAAINLLETGVKIERWYTPRDLSAKLSSSYGLTLKRVKDLQAQMRLELVKNRRLQKSEIDEALALVRPLASLTDVNLQSSATQIKQIISNLSAVGLAETEALAKLLAAQARQKWPKMFDTKSSPSLENKAQSLINELVNKLPQTMSEVGEPLRLVRTWPLNELDLLDDLLYQPSGLSLDKLADSIDSWTYQQKSEAFLKLAVTSSPSLSKTLQKAYYQWDMLSDSDTLLSLLRLPGWREVQIQPASVRYGYDMPSVIERAGLEDRFQECFDASLVLYSELQSSKLEAQGQYAVLAGHKVRWQAAISAGDFLELLSIVRNTPQIHPGAKKLLKGMQARITEAHSLIGALAGSLPETRPAAPAASPPAPTRVKKIAPKPTNKANNPPRPRSRSKRGRGRPRKNPS